MWIRRDKQIAHAEDIVVPDELRVTWSEAVEHIEFAQRFAGVVGEAYGAFTFGADDGSYMLQEHSEETAESLRRLLERAGLLDANRGNRPRIQHGGLTAEAEQWEGIWITMVLDAEERLVGTGSTFEEAREDVKKEIDDYLARRRQTSEDSLCTSNGV